MQSPEDAPLEIPAAMRARKPGESRTPIAPVWHTLVLLAAVVLLSILGANQFSASHAVAVNRLRTYAVTGGMDLVMVGWVYFGMRLRKASFRALFGFGSVRNLLVDAGAAIVFWFAALMVLATVGLFWTVTEAAIQHRPLIPPAGQPIAPDPAQQQTLRTLTALVPSNGYEAMAWVGLCVMAGLAEEIIFRGYFQQQFTAWSRGAVAGGVLLSAAVFGAAHGYQGMRNMLLLAIFGALFSLLALFRGNLRACMLAHTWHDLVAGLLLALLKAHHRI